MKRIELIEVDQPIGTLYMGKIRVKDLIDIKIIKRKFDGKGVQRLLKSERVRSIALFCTDPDATFPTPIIISVSRSDMEFIDQKGMICEFEYNENERFAEVLDGQHRIEGIELATKQDDTLNSMEIPIIVMFDLTDSQKAYVFSTINGNQAPVNPSLIFDLFGLAEGRSPYKTCHEIARALNSNNKSPFYCRLKMLEKREKNTETITQNAFVKNLCDLISKDPQKDEISLKKGQKLEPNNKLSLRKFFISNNDAIILKILINYFSAVKKVFPEEWIDTKDYILTKTVGFSGVIQALNIIVPIGEKNNQLTESFFERIFEQLKEDLKKEGKKLTISDFPSNGAGTKDLTDMIIQSTNKVYVDNSY